MTPLPTSTHRRFFVAASRVEYALVALGAAAYAALLAHYFVSPAFKDHLEASIGAIASALLRGQPPYHGVTGEASYELPYGPNAFIVHALSFELVGRSIAALKLPALLANIGACALTFAMLRRRVSLRCASGGLLLLVLYLVYYDARAYWCRPEPFLFLGSALGLWLVRARPRTSIVAHALVFAWMINLKVTGFLYVVPTLTLFAAQRGWRRAVAAMAFGGALALAELATPPFSIHAYADVLTKTARHGLSLNELVLNLSAGALLVVPVVVVRAFRRRGAPVAPQRASWRVPFVALVVCIAVVCVIAAKPGAGRHHLLPFIPLAIDAFIDAVDGIERDRIDAFAARVGTLLSCAREHDRGVGIGERVRSLAEECARTRQ